MYLTVFTPTYNRKTLLKRVYRSLLWQTCSDFKWLIVDDGSDDGTRETVESFIDEGRIDITYIYRENGGKMRAHNTGVMACDTELFVCLDSDDYFTKDAVDVILNEWEKIRTGSQYAGLIAHKGSDEMHTLYQAMFPDDSDTTLKGLYDRGFDGETTLVIRTELLKEHLFPEIPGEKYVPEDFVYDQIDSGHVFAVVPRILTVCEIVDSGYTDRAAQLRKKNPTGWFLYYARRAVSGKMGMMRIKYASHYMRFEHLVAAQYRKKYVLPFYMRFLGFPGMAILLLKGKT